MINYRVQTIGKSGSIFLIREDRGNFGLDHYLSIDKSMLKMDVSEIDNLINFLQEYKHANENGNIGL
jgi:hypothetical protein